MAGLCYEDLTPGLVIDHAIRRTCTEMDGTLFSALTFDCEPLHIDAEYAKDSVHGQRQVNNMFVLALVCGVIVIDLTIGTTLGNLGFGETKFPNPVFHGDTIHVRTEIVEGRLSKKRSDSGVVVFRHIGLNQRNEIVCDCLRTGLMMTRAAYQELLARMKAEEEAAGAATAGTA